ncbi:MAG: hypothetical protein A2649_02930 [Candidatus Yanofskybacteria bacterium RIFCSPHIGHO2_01_FULL_41_26]|uniref:Uncharacterized protein n=1 Tax=Candidatus Yanofskybacteria bacterium RIFCSPHIGHO2_01_FULL_41_26 TaxID=1802661 RepID=A0A1F8ECF4_9BACT|nr:MAG: hypothetical protein A2649_02930 [Candidatus Yanofskybacteria bacterium RIFCSPHIGHO2_01_FULL_41_26]
MCFPQEPNGLKWGWGFVQDLKHNKRPSHILPGRTCAGPEAWCLVRGRACRWPRLAGSRGLSVESGVCGWGANQKNSEIEALVNN